MRRAVVAGLFPNLLEVETPCTDCGKRATVYDHRDYGRPLDVEPVCQSCNLKRGPAKQSQRSWAKWYHDYWTLNPNPSFPLDP